MRRLSLWMRAHPMVGDTLIAVVLLLGDLVLFIAAHLTDKGEPKPWFVAIPVNVLMVLPVVFRRKHPIVAAYAILVMSVLHSTLELGLAAVVSSAIAIYTMVVYAGRRPAAYYVAATVAVSLVQTFLQFRADWPLMIIVTVLHAAFSWVLGEFVGARRAYHHELEARLHLLETERDQSARIAVAEERGRIARELHDVVAHSVSVMVVQADGAAYAIRGNPDVAERAVRTISDTGRGALAELRRLLGVLRNEKAGGEPRVPQPDARSLADLAERMRAAGLPVRLDLDGDLGDLPTGVSLGAYRIVQESLTNVLKHAGNGAKAEVRLTRADDALEVEVSDDGGGRAHALTGTAELQAASGGNGLIGMRERANVFGGRLEAGPVPGGGWRVRAVLPVGGES